MIDLLSTGKNKKNISVKYLLLTFFVCVSMVAWLGISDLRADVDDPEDNTDEIEEGFQNTAQEQHAENIAREAASQDSDWPDKDKDEYDEIVGEFVADVIVNDMIILELKSNEFQHNDANSLARKPVFNASIYKKALSLPVNP